MDCSQNFNCFFCKESFDNKEELQIHFRKHGDPMFNQSVKNSKSKLQNEMASLGEKSDDVELVSCDVCSEVFPSVSKAITHKHKVHPDHDGKYFCPWCGKLFTMKHLYNKHIQTNHEAQLEMGGSGFPCDYCEVAFMVPSAMVYHNKFFHRQDTELAIIGHSKKLKLYNQEPMQIFYCPFCGEEYCNKVNLHKHMGDDHSDENQSPEDVLRCALCEAVFYHLDAYELHLTFHSTEDLYSEENEIAKQITEFSLETTPPIMEKVENESQDEQTVDSIGIGELLQQAMDESNDNTNDSGREKKKKHKKHKKSKKAAITLDEFLTMNTDVFGEGLDFHGIEEVPTQVVAKQLKKKPLSQKAKPGPKPSASAELAKLKKQGIVVKKKPAQNNKLRGFKVVTQKSKVTSTDILQNINKLKPAVQANPNTMQPNEVLTKLLNQNNSEIKITKKPSQSDLGNEACQDDNAADNIESKPSNESNILPCNVVKDNDNAQLTHDEGSNELKSVYKDKSNGDMEQKIEKDLTEVQKNSSSQNNLDNLKFVLVHKPGTKINSPSPENIGVNETLTEECDDEYISNKKPVNIGNSNDTLNVLKNISQHLTVKSVKSTNYPTFTQKPNPERTEKKKVIDDDTENNEEHPKDNEEQAKDDISDDSERAVKPGDKRSSINPLKHLSHLTVKPMNSKSESFEENRIISKTDNVNVENKTVNLKTDDTKEVKQEDSINIKTEMKNTSSKLEALKNLSKHITVKSLSPSPNSHKSTPQKTGPNITEHDETCNDNISSDFNEDLSHNELVNHIKGPQNNVVAGRAVTNIKSPEIKKTLPNHSPKIMSKVASAELQKQEEDDPCSKILKKLLNVTAKPLNRNLNQQTATQAQNSETVVNTQKSFSEKKDENIEIFNVDDSDDEDVSNTATKFQANEKHILHTTKNIESQISTQNSMNTLQKINKQITIKPKTQPKAVINKALRKFDEMSSDEEANSSDHGEHDIELDNKPHHGNSILQNKLKNLSNITFKSNNSPKTSPALKKQQIYEASEQSSITSKCKTTFPGTPPFKRTPQKPHNAPQVDEYDSDSMSPRVKITELPDDYTSDDDIPLQDIKANDGSPNHSPTINHPKISQEEPNDSDSDNATYDDFEDIEQQIKLNTVQRPRQESNSNNRPTCLSNLKNITIKSSKENKEADSKTLTNPIENTVISTPNKEPPRNPSKPKPVIRNEGGCALNHNASTSLGQINTINQEVTVQTFQSKTVIQEITTTVTKTIRTVNQTMKQEMQHKSHGNNMPVRPQRIQNIRPQLQMPNQRVPIRAAAPVLGTKIRHASPVMSGNIPPCNQLVPVRPRANVARLSSPRMPVMKPPAMKLSNSPQTSVTGRPLKISPNAVVPSMKRPIPEEPNGPFSCFKKPKESLIPEVPVFSKKQEESVHYASSTQMSKSNTTTKTLKNNSVITSMNVKAEASSTQVSKLNNMTGLKVVKTSQTQNVSKVEEKTEMSAPKRSTLEAIEKLQRHGLIVKKPRVEEPDDSEHSDFENEFYEET